jgi:hypothetical protein
MTAKVLKAQLARFMDPGAFRDSVPESVKGTSPVYGKALHDRLKVRREISLKRADAAIRFFLKPDNLAALNTRAANAKDDPQ